MTGGFRRTFAEKEWLWREDKEADARKKKAGRLTEGKCNYSCGKKKNKSKGRLS